MKSSIVFICNPAAKRASDRKIAQASRFLKLKGYEVEVFFTEQRGDAENFAKKISEKNSELLTLNSELLIIAAGGDGTFNEVINGIVGSKIPMAILPLGTTNVLAKELSIPEAVEGAMEVAISNTPKKVSLGKIVRSSGFGVHRRQFTYNSSLPGLAPQSGAGVTRYFCLMAGIGFDGETVFRINETLKKVSGKGAYIYSGIKTLSKFNPYELTFDIDGKTYSGYSAIIGKAAKYGGNFKVTPDARLTDPVLYICLFKGKKRSDIFRYVCGIVAGRHLRFSDVEYLKAESIEINGNAHIQIDGDYFGMTPAKIEVVPNILRLIYPAP
ncbi:MAG: diacylglycerol kinase family lipid kinase [Nitrospirae bacterium]|nr:diacylglycerol kinase family lipid kinase [Nitrospirota bacterium]